MADTKRPLPVPDNFSKPYFDGAKRHELMIQRCKTCGAYQVPGRLRCDICLNNDIEWVKASGKGKIFSFGIMHQLYHPGFASEIPYNVTVVELAEGVRINTNIVGCPNSELSVDMPVEVTFEDINEELSIPKFKPAR